MFWRQLWVVVIMTARKITSRQYLRSRWAHHVWWITFPKGDPLLWWMVIWNWKGQQRDYIRANFSWWTRKTIDMQASQPILLVNSRLAKGCSSLVAEDGGCRRGGDAIHLRSCKDRIWPVFHPTCFFTDKSMFCFVSGQCLSKFHWGFAGSISHSF